MPSPHPTVPAGEIGQRWTLARGMLMLGSCREDYWVFNPPKFLSALTSRQGAVGGCSSARGVGRWVGTELTLYHKGGISAWSHLRVLHRF